MTTHSIARASRVVLIALVGTLALLSSCTKRNPLYCSANPECKNSVAPFCDTSKNECRGCTGNAECMALDPSTPTCNAKGMCVECDTNTDCHVASYPFCDSAKAECRGCGDRDECVAINPATPVCLAFGGCAECGEDADCTAADKPVCDRNMHKCRACGANTECAKLDVASAVCDPSGACVGCSAHADCKTPEKAICDADTNVCRGCKAAEDCTASSPAKPVCATTGLCVECTANLDCKTATKPICNLASNTCRGCEKDSECPADPGVCMAHTDGHCAVANETIYVQDSGTGTCSDAPPAPQIAATKATPACSLQAGLALLSPSRPLVVVRGAVYAGDSPVIATTETFVHSIVGQSSATTTTLATGFTLRSGSVYLRDLKIGSAYNNALTATGGTLRLDGVKVDTCLNGGILLDGAAFDIRNTSVSNSGPGNVGGFIVGGIFVRTLATSGPKQLTNVSLQGNQPFDLSCTSPVMGSGVLAPGIVDGNCGITVCTTPGPTCGAP